MGNFQLGFMIRPTRFSKFFSTFQILLDSPNPFLFIFNTVEGEGAVSVERENAVEIVKGKGACIAPVCQNFSINPEYLQFLEMKKKGKRIKTANGEIQLLPEAMIQHIQSFMSGKEAARTTILSKLWYNAWLTRPSLDFDAWDFIIFTSKSQRISESQRMFEEYATKTVQRYQNSSMKIDSLRLSSRGSWGHSVIPSGYNLIVGAAMKMGATTVQLENCSFTWPQELLGSETLLKLSVISCEVEGNYDIRCSRLKSLTLKSVNFKNNGVFKDMITCCISMEELSLCRCSGLELSLTNLYELHKLRHLLLDHVVFDNMFFTDFGSRFPCLRDLSIIHCNGCTDIQIASSSLETICFKTDKASEAAKFYVPNIRKFTYSCYCLPSQLSINGPSREWQFDISITSNRFHRISWFINLRKILKKFRLSRISLCIHLYSTSGCQRTEHAVDVEVIREPLVLENLTIEAPPTFYSALMVRSLGAFRPKFITRGHNLFLDKVTSIPVLHKRLIQSLFVSNWQEKFGQLGLKKVNVEIYEKFDAVWQPLQLKKLTADFEGLKKASEEIYKGFEAEWRPLRLKKLMADFEGKVRLQLMWED